MPLYEYTCHECGRESELLVTASSQPACPECGSPKIAKLLSIVAAPARSTSSSDSAQMPSGPCGTHCGCFPQG